MQIQSFFKKHYYPLNTIEISSSALLNNYHYLSQLDTTKQVAPVLKSNAYGHGLVLIAKILDDANPPFFCVDSLYEAYELLKNNIKTPILIMGYVNPENLRVKKLPFSYVVYSKEQVAGIKKYQPHAGIHIFIDTGMHREGIAMDDLPSLVSYINSMENAHIEGVMSHLGAGEKARLKSTREQIINFALAVERIKKNGFSPRYIHIANAEALLHSEEYDELPGNIARCGIGLYGINPDGMDKNLYPVLRLVTTLNQVKRIRKGESVGYDFTFTAKKEMTIGILPLGYFDGVDRRLSNRGVVLLQGGKSKDLRSSSSISQVFAQEKTKYIECPIIGRVSMNLTTIDLSKVVDPHVGQQAIVYSLLPTDKNSLAKAAVLCGTIPHELLIHLSASTKRVLV